MLQYPIWSPYLSLILAGNHIVLHILPVPLQYIIVIVLLNKESRHDNIIALYVEMDHK